MTVTESGDVVLQAKGLSKSFGGIAVLHEVDLTIRAGEVHALLGENGAGKSTLAKLLCGFESPSAGEIEQASEANSQKCIAGWSQAEAERHGVVLIHQEFNLADQLSVVDNIFLGHELSRGLLLDKSRMRNEARSHLETLKCELDLDASVADLAVSQKQMVEIARMQTKSLRVLFLDEPTAVLTRQESASLFELLGRLKAQSVAIVFISHKLDEIERYSDRLTVLRDGRVVTSGATADFSKDDMVRHMVGRELSSLFPQVAAAQNECALEVRDLPLAGGETVSFEVRRGEILGFAGLVGSGRTALFENLVGLARSPRKPAADAVVRIAGRDVHIADPAQARDLGIVYLTKDRKGKGLLLDSGLLPNFSLFSLHRYGRTLIDKGSEKAAFEQAVDTFDIRFKDTRVKAGNLSGGNQQKLLLAKVMAAEPKIVIIDEPTRGIDIGTRSQIYHFIARLTGEGVAVILISSDLTEIIGLSHRVAVMYHDRLTGILQGADINEEEIMRYATGQKGVSGPLRSGIEVSEHAGDRHHA